MAELLLELFSEEIPARMQARAADDLARLVTDGLKAAGLEVGDTRAFATPRRLALVVENVPEKSPAVSEERKGPRVGAPEQAMAGFLKAAGFGSVKDAEIVRDAKKGDYYVARINRPGRKANEIVAEVAGAVLAKFPCARGPLGVRGPQARARRARLGGAPGLRGREGAADQGDRGARILTGRPRVSRP